jgi:hypothetical protein
MEALKECHHHAFCVQCASFFFGDKDREHATLM